MVDSNGMTRIIDMQWRDIPRGFECESAFEMTRADGSKTLVREFWRQIDLGDSYVTLRHAARDSQPAQTFLVTGKKGEIEGDFRTDVTEMLTFGADGSVRRTEQTVKTWLKGDEIRDKARTWYREGREAGLTADEIFQLLRSLESGESADR